MATQHRYSIELRRQVVQEYQAGETLTGSPSAMTSAARFEQEHARQTVNSAA
jgi:hypothetical protein